MSRCTPRHWNNFSVLKQEECLNAKKLDRFTIKQKCTKLNNEQFSFKQDTESKGRILFVAYVKSYNNKLDHLGN